MDYTNEMPKTGDLKRMVKCFPMTSESWEPPTKLFLVMNEHKGEEAGLFGMESEEARDEGDYGKGFWNLKEVKTGKVFAAKFHPKEKWIEMDRWMNDNGIPLRPEVEEMMERDLNSPDPTREMLQQRRKSDCWEVLSCPTHKQEAKTKTTRWMEVAL